MALLKYLCAYYKLAEMEEWLCSQNIKPLLDTQGYRSTISKYFRLMNRIDYADLSASDREYLSQSFTNEMDVEQNWNREPSVTIYQKIIKNIQLRPKGYTEYRCDGSATENAEPRFLASNFALNHYITFGIYYTQFIEGTDCDDFRNHNLVNRIVCQLRDKGLDAVKFSEVDMYRMVSITDIF